MVAVDKIFDKLEGNADKLGALLGFFGGASNVAKPMGTSTLSWIQQNITDLMRDPHIPDISHVLDSLTYGYQSQTFKGAIMAWLGGYVLKEVDIDPAITKLGSALSKAGFGAALGVTAYSIVEFSGTGHSDGADGSTGGGHHQLYLKPQRDHAGHFTMPNVAPTRNIGTIVAGVPHP